jgi:hypothetical protein
MRQAKSNFHPMTRWATNSGLLGLFLSALRFMVAVIFKGRCRAMSASTGVLSNRALASVSMYFVGNGFVMKRPIRIHVNDHRLHPSCTSACSKSDQYRSSLLIRDVRAAISLTWSKLHRLFFTDRPTCLRPSRRCPLACGAREKRRPQPV